MSIDQESGRAGKRKRKEEDEEEEDEKEESSAGDSKGGGRDVEGTGGSKKKKKVEGPTRRNPTRAARAGKKDGTEQDAESKSSLSGNSQKKEGRDSDTSPSHSDSQPSSSATISHEKLPPKLRAKMARSNNKTRENVVVPQIVVPDQVSEPANVTGNNNNERKSRTKSTSSSNTPKSNRSRRKPTTKEKETNKPNNKKVRKSSTKEGNNTKSTPTPAHDLPKWVSNPSRSEPAKLWAFYENFSADVDKPYLERNEFQICLNLLGLEEVSALNKEHWRFIRSLMGKPRRLSPTFLSEERDKIEEHRIRLRGLNRSNTNNFPLPNRVLIWRHEDKNCLESKILGLGSQQNLFSVRLLDEEENVEVKDTLVMSIKDRQKPVLLKAPSSPSALMSSSLVKTNGRSTVYDLARLGASLVDKTQKLEDEEDKEEFKIHTILHQDKNSSLENHSNSPEINNITNNTNNTNNSNINSSSNNEVSVLSGKFEMLRKLGSIVKLLQYLCGKEEFLRRLKEMNVRAEKMSVEGELGKYPQDFKDNYLKIVQKIRSVNKKIIHVMTDLQSVQEAVQDLSKGKE